MTSTTLEMDVKVSVGPETIDLATIPVRLWVKLSAWLAGKEVTAAHVSTTWPRSLLIFPRHRLL